MKEENHSAEEVIEPEIVDESQPYRKFFSQLDDQAQGRDFSGISNQIIFRGTIAVIITAILFFVFFGAVIWLLFHLLPFIFAFVLFIIVAGGIFSLFQYIYLTFMKNKS